MVIRYSAFRRDSDAIPPEVIDRILIGACAAVWLVWLGVSVAAVVALVDLGRGFHKVASSSHTTWVLYAVIIISALIIAGAIPVLLRARRMSQARPVTEAMTAPGRGADESPVRPGPPRARLGADRPQPPRVPSAELAAEWSGAEVDRVWLRGTVLLAGTIGVALIAVAAATYLMAIGHDRPSWVCYGLAGAVTAVLPVIEWLHVRQLRRVRAEH